MDDTSKNIVWKFPLVTLKVQIYKSTKSIVGFQAIHQNALCIIALCSKNMNHFNA